MKGLPPVNSRPANPGLPRGVSPHGAGFRCRYKPKPDSSATKWSPVFPTAQACYAYLELARQAWSDSRPAPTPAVRPVRMHWTFAEYARAPWWAEYLRTNPAESTQADTLRLLALHIEPCQWTQRDLCDIPRRVLRDWFDMRVENKVPDAQLSSYDLAPDLAAIAAARGHDGPTSNDQVRYIHSLVRRVFEAAVTDENTLLKKSPMKGVQLKAAPEGSEDDIEAQQLKVHTRMVSRHHIAPIAQRLPYVDLIPFWFVYLLGLRVGEAFGVRCADWDSKSGVLRVRRQYQPKRLKDGSVRVLVKRLKTRSSRRDLFVGPSLARAIDAYILAVHGPNPEPETRICVGAQGPATVWGLLSGFIGRVQRAAKDAGLTVDRPGYMDTPLVPRAHSFRKAIASELHECPHVPDSAISRYLGHRITKDDDVADVTREVYTVWTVRGMKKVADYVENLVGELGLDLLPAPSEDYVSIKEAAALLDMGVRAVRHGIAQSTIPASRNVVRPFGAATATKWWIKRSDITALKSVAVPPRDVAVPVPEAAAMLGVRIQTVRHLMTPSMGCELVRWQPPAHALGIRGTYVTVESIRARLQVAARFANEELILEAVARRRYPDLDLEALITVGVSRFVHGGTVVYDDQAIADAARRAMPEGHVLVIDAARHCQLSVHQFRVRAGYAAAVHYSGLSVPVEVRDRVAAAGRAATRRRTASDLRTAQRRAEITFDPPDARVWVPLAEIATRIDQGVVALANLLEGRGGPRYCYRGELYGRRTDVAAMEAECFPAGWITIRRASELLERKESAVREMVRHNVLVPRKVRQPRRMRVLVSEADVHALLARERSLPELVPASQAAAYLGVQPITLDKFVQQGQLCPASDGQSVRRHQVFERADLHAFQLRHSPTPDMLTLSQFLAAVREAGTDLTYAYVVKLAARGVIPGGRRYLLAAGRWWVPAASALEVAQFYGPGYLTGAEVLRRAGFKPGNGHDHRLSAWADKGQLPRAKRLNGRSYYRYPQSAVEVVHRLMAEIGFTPVLDGQAADPPPRRRSSGQLRPELPVAS